MVVRVTAQGRVCRDGRRRFPDVQAFHLVERALGQPIQRLPPAQDHLFINLGFDRILLRLLLDAVDVGNKFADFLLAEEGVQVPEAVARQSEDDEMRGVDVFAAAEVGAARQVVVELLQLKRSDRRRQRRLVQRRRRRQVASPVGNEDIISVTINRAALSKC